MNVVDCQRDQTLVELAGVKKELGRVMAELKGFHVREAGRMGDMRALKQSNKKLQEEVKRLDAVALDLENELSAAEIKLEKYQSGELQSAKVLEHTRALEERLGERETDCGGTRVEDRRFDAPSVCAEGMHA
jgi:predicted  nucleic acid-binding Zn-ribbon protein